MVHATTDWTRGDMREKEKGYAHDRSFSKYICSKKVLTHLGTEFQSSVGTSTKVEFSAFPTVTYWS